MLRRRSGGWESAPAAPMHGSTRFRAGTSRRSCSRWQAVTPRLMLLDEPFQGVDVGARADIAAAIRAQAQVATLIATSDAEEALEVADRIYRLDADGLAPLHEQAA